MNEANQNYNELAHAKYAKLKAMMTKADTNIKEIMHEDPGAGHMLMNINISFRKIYKDIESLEKVEIADEEQYNAQMRAFDRAIGGFMEYVGQSILPTENVINNESSKHNGELNLVYFEFRGLVDKLPEVFPSEYVEKSRELAYGEHTTIPLAQREKEVFGQILGIVDPDSNPNWEDKIYGFNLMQDFCERTGRMNEYEGNLFLTMAADPQFCRLRVLGAQQYIESIAAGNKTDEYTEERLRTAALTIAVGERFKGEIKNYVYNDNKSIDKSKRDFYIPNPLFRLNESALLPGMEQEQKSPNQLVNDIVEGIKNTFDFDYMKPKGSLKDFAKELNSKFSEAALNQPKGQPQSKEMRKILMAGAVDPSVLIIGDDMLHLAGTGSPEYTNMHNAYAAYIADLRTPGKNCNDSIDHIKDFAFDYLNKKDAIPFTTEGKKRVEAASKLYTLAAMNSIINGRSTNEDIENLKQEMIRNKNCRDMVMESCEKNFDAIENNPAAGEIFLFARQCEVRANNFNFKNGVIIEGKGTDGQVAERLHDMRSSIEIDAGIKDNKGKISENFKKSMDEYKAQHAPQVKPAEKVLNNSNNQTLNIK